MSWKRLSRELQYDNPYYRVYLDKVENSKKQLLDYHTIAVHPSVMVITVTDDEEIILIRQYRYLMDEWCIELPCGNSEGIDLETAAKKELREETGIMAEKWQQLGSFFPYNGLCTEECHIFLATGLSFGQTDLEDSEEIEILKTARGDIATMIAQNKIKDGQTLAALHLYFAQYPLSSSFSEPQ